MIDWNDLHVALAVARTGSAAAAARALGVDATTISRRISALETALGQPLFERRPDGFRLIEGREDLMGRAERLAAEMEAFQTFAIGRRRRLEGRIRVTATETMVAHLLGPVVFRLRRDHPGLRVEIVVDDRRLDIVHAEADVALRVGSTPTEPTLVAQRLPDSCWSVYCSRAYAAAYGRPSSSGDLKAHLLVAGEGPLAAIAPLAWLETQAPGAEVVCRCNTIPNLAALVAAGVGVSVLPCLIGETSEDLVRCLAPPAQLRSELWLLYHESQRRSDLVRPFVEALAREVRAHRRLLDPAA